MIQKSKIYDRLWRWFLNIELSSVAQQATGQHLHVTKARETIASLEM